MRLEDVVDDGFCVVLRVSSFLRTTRFKDSCRLTFRMRSSTSIHAELSILSRVDSVSSTSITGSSSSFLMKKRLMKWFCSFKQDLMNRSAAEH